MKRTIFLPMTFWIAFASFSPLVLHVSATTTPLFEPILSTQRNAQQSEEGVTAKEQAIAKMVREYRASFPEVKGISARALMAALDSENPPVMIDVRPERERRIARIPGAIDREAFEAEPDRYARRPLVAYCTIGYRSGKFADRYRKQGIEILNLEGSLLSWTHAAGRLVDNAGRETRQLHVYGKRWNLAASGYDPVW